MGLYTNFIDSRYLMLSISGHVQIYTCKKQQIEIEVPSSFRSFHTRHFNSGFADFFQLNQHKQETPPSDIVFFYWFHSDQIASPKLGN